MAWREQVATEKRAAYRDEDYWGRPVTGIGPSDAPLLLVGLAPAAHGGNRTGRMFTGDRSADVLFAALHAVGLASQPTSVHRDDGLALYGTRITAPVHCAPPDNKPTPDERDRCRALAAPPSWHLLAPTVRAVVVLGAFGWQALLPVLARSGWAVPRPRPRFSHGADVDARSCCCRSEGICNCLAATTSASRTPSPGKLTPAMLEEVLGVAAHAAGLR